MHVIGVPEGEERQKWGRKVIEEVVAKNFTNLVNNLILQIKKLIELQTGLI